MCRAELWERLTSTDEYLDWWPWLRRFDDGGGFEESQRWACLVAPPLPYRVAFEVTLDRVERAQRVDATVTGDIAGTARLTLIDHRRGCVARLESVLQPSHPVLRGYGLVARPLVEMGHGWVLDRGRRQFVENALH